MTKIMKPSEKRIDVARKDLCTLYGKRILMNTVNSARISMHNRCTNTRKVGKLRKVHVSQMQDGYIRASG